MVILFLPGTQKGLTCDGLKDVLQVPHKREGTSADGLEFSTAMRSHAGGDSVTMTPHPPHLALCLAPCKSNLTS